MKNNQVSNQGAENYDADDMKLRLCASIQNTLVKEHMLLQLLGMIPHPVLVYQSDGTLIAINKIFLATFKVLQTEAFLGKYNLFRDPFQNTQEIKHIKNAFEGNLVTLRDVKIKISELKKLFRIPVTCTETIYVDIIYFPLRDESGELYVLSIMNTKRVFTERDEVSEAVVYIKEHWKEEFRVAEAARIVNLSPAYFSRLFKKLIGVSPHQYYINIKVEKLKERLMDANLTVEEAFLACGIRYHSYYASVFRKNTGLTPSAYRKTVHK